MYALCLFCDEASGAKCLFKLFLFVMDDFFLWACRSGILLVC